MTARWEPRWDHDHDWGAAGERFVEDLTSRRVETKRKRRMDDWLYVELEQDPGATGQEWKPSGLEVTQADYWAWVIHETGIVVFLPVDLLRWAVNEGLGRAKEETDGGNPTKGRLVRLGLLIQEAKNWLGAGGRP